MNTRWDDVVVAVSAESVTASLKAITDRWEAPSTTHTAFREWAISLAVWMVGEGPDNLSNRVSFLQDQFRWLHAEIAENLIYRGNVDEILVARRTFVASILASVVPLVKHEQEKVSREVSVAA